ncbi:MAG TPA: heavy-metal-associated domain-containing protein [Solirubrobacteraceae bacterium]|nr:heavy-metal-associated domain-containing protein [Solirubrobacteraceae bacterium]
MSTPSDHPQSPSTEQLAFTVAGMTCDHCTVAVTHEVTKVAGVTLVDVAPDTKLVQVHGSGIDAAAVVAAIDEAGYDAVTA